jgi:hypothetical protein
MNACTICIGMSGAFEATNPRGFRSSLMSPAHAARRRKQVRYVTRLRSNVLELVDRLPSKYSWVFKRWHTPLVLHVYGCSAANHSHIFMASLPFMVCCAHGHTTATAHHESEGDPLFVHRLECAMGYRWCCCVYCWL